MLRQDRMAAPLERMLDLHKQLAAPLAARRTSRPCSDTTPKAEATDRQVDQLVYGLYRLTHTVRRDVDIR